MKANIQADKETDTAKIKSDTTKWNSFMKFVAGAAIVAIISNFDKIIAVLK